MMPAMPHMACLLLSGSLGLLAAGGALPRIVPREETAAYGRMSRYSSMSQSVTVAMKRSHSSRL
jgi:hypothetical protein